MAIKKYTNSKELWDKIKNLRLSKNLSQEDIANLIWISRVTLATIESWERNIKEDELEIISEIFEKPFCYFVKEEDEIKELVKDDKNYIFKKVFLYILNKVWEKANVGKIVVYKLLYFSEFNHYEMFWKSLLNIDFRKWPMWPVPNPDEVKDIFEEMKEDNQVKEVKTFFKWYNQHRFVSQLKDIDFYDLVKDLEPNQIKIIDDVIDKLSNMTATQISEYSHSDMPYKATKEMWDIISKTKVFYRTPDYSITYWNDD